MTPRGFDPRPIARRFWVQVGYREAFPRRLTRPVAEVLPVAVIRLPRLSLGSMAEWLERRGAACLDVTQDRSLRGCLIAQRGHGFIFIDGTLPVDEQLHTLAHETAHFLHHYQAPRTTALEVLGSSLKAVLDGDRPPTPTEKLSGVLRGVPIGAYRHSLDRTPDGLPDAHTQRMECEADLVAFELLAPSDRLSATTAPGDDCRTALQADYGLPPWAARAWGGWIDAHRAGDGLIARLEVHRRKNPS
jgi:hypothetical protein